MSLSQDRADLRDDARCLRVAVAILRARSVKPKSYLCRFLCFGLETCAAGLDKKADHL